jgi:hypothetical protein
MYLLTAGYCVYANSNKSTSKEQPKYEVKSDIINFDYGQLAYPFKGVGIGFKTDTSRVPKKIVPAREPKAEQVEPLTMVLDACKLTINIIILVVFCFAVVIYLPAVLVEIFLIVRKFIITLRKEKEDIFKN